MTPRVSICVPTYNRAPFLRASLRNVLAQDAPDLEILISDNASDDGTEAICREAAAADARVRYVRQPRNLGLYGNHNFCLEESRGEFLSFFHDDDEHDPSLCSRYAAFLEAHPDVGVVCADWELMNETGRSLGVRAHRVEPVTPGREYITRTIRSGHSSIACPGAMIRRSALGPVRFDEDGAIGFGDFVVWFRIAEQAAVGHLSERLWRYRFHPGSLSRRPIASIAGDYSANLQRYCDGYLRRWPADDALVRSWRKAITRFVFWSLVYEVGRHYERRDPASAGQEPRSIFEAMGYRLTPEELTGVLEQMAACRTGTLEQLTEAAVRGLHRSQCRSLLGWIPRCGPPMRALVLGRR